MGEDAFGRGGVGGRKGGGSSDDRWSLSTDVLKESTLWYFRDFLD